MSTKELGDLAERIAVAFLEMNGYAILATNYRFQRNEIDVIARTGGRIVFVEVKCRTGAGRGLPCEAVGPAKIRLSERGLADRPSRFDVVSVRMERGGLALLVEHMVGVFGADGGRW